MVGGLVCTIATVGRLLILSETPLPLRKGVMSLTAPKPGWGLNEEML